MSDLPTPPNDIGQIFDKWRGKMLSEGLMSPSSANRIDDEAKAALQTLIADKERLARLDELKRAAAHNNSEYTSDYLEERIQKLSENS
jgi:hypothetical protein